ncbi:MAG: helix-turn-helix domain-containing protein [Bacteroidia bacterium]
MSLTRTQRIVRAKRFIDKAYEQPLNLNRLSQEAYLSKYHFLRVFKKTYRITPHQYLLRRRIEQAKDALRENKLNVNEICYLTGFESHGSFSSLFKREVGMSPSQYRKFYLKQREQAQKQPRQFIPHCFINRFTGEE